MDTVPCTPCCTTPQTTNIPGPAGSAGPAGSSGSNGQNAFTLLTANLTLPAVSASTTLFVASSTWMAVGQRIFASDGTHFGTFTITAIPGVASVTGTFLGYTGDSAPGTVVATGGAVVASGTQPTVQTMLPTLSGYAVGGSQALTNAYVQALTRTITLGVSGHHILYAAARFDYVAATFAGNQIISLKLKRTNNTPTDISNAIGNLQTQIITTKSFTAGEIVLVPVDYNGTAGDIIQPQVQVDTTPGAGAVNVVECAIFALPIF